MSLLCRSLYLSPLPLLILWFIISQSRECEECDICASSCPKEDYSESEGMTGLDNLAFSQIKSRPKDLHVTAELVDGVVRTFKSFQHLKFDTSESSFLHTNSCICSKKGVVLCLLDWFPCLTQTLVGPHHDSCHKCSTWGLVCMYSISFVTTTPGIDLHLACISPVSKHSNTCKTLKQGSFHNPLNPRTWERNRSRDPLANFADVSPYFPHASQSAQSDSRNKSPVSNFLDSS